MALVLELHRRGTVRRPAGAMARLKHAVEICTIAGAFVFLFAFAVGLM